MKGQCMELRVMIPGAAHWLCELSEAQFPYLPSLHYIPVTIPGVHSSKLKGPECLCGEKSFCSPVLKGSHLVSSWFHSLSWYQGFTNSQPGWPWLGHHVVCYHRRIMPDCPEGCFKRHIVSLAQPSGTGRAREHIGL